MAANIPALSVPTPQAESEHERIVELMQRHYERLAKILAEIDEFLAETPPE